MDGNTWWLRSCRSEGRIAVTKRRAFDFYPTPEWATRELLKRTGIGGFVFEPCVGQWDIANALAGRVRHLDTNDLDPARDADSHYDASSESCWIARPIDYVVTNPPFSRASQILPLAVEHAKIGVYMLLRLSYLEPCENRAAWLEAHPPNFLMVLPRISFTGDGKTDSVTCAWMGWDKYRCGQTVIIANPKSESARLEEGAA